MLKVLSQIGFQVYSEINSAKCFRNCALSLMHSFVIFQLLPPFCFFLLLLLMLGISNLCETEFYFFTFVCETVMGLSFRTHVTVLVIH